MLLSIIGVLATILIGYGIIKLADLVEWLRKRNIPAFIKYTLIAVLFIIALILVILI
jgi:uncharacterized membrane protein